VEQRKFKFCNGEEFKSLNVFQFKLYNELQDPPNVQRW